MEKWVEDLFNEGILKKAADFYGAEVTKAKKLGDFENYVYEVHREGIPYILRLTHSSHRNRAGVEAELEYVNYLNAQGVNVSLVSHSLAGNLVEEIPAGDTFFFVCLFDKAPGEPVRVQSDLFSPPLFKEWGRTIGKMNKAAKGFSEGRAHREHWYEDDLLKNMSTYLSEEDTAIIKEGEELIEKLHSFSTGRGEYGLVHSDIHSGNFFLHEGEIHVFDFDDCSYHWYASDIAIPLFYAVWAKMPGKELEERSRFGEEFLKSFLSGYFEENTLDEEWIKRIPLFLRLRDIVLYTVFHKKFDMSSLSEREAGVVAGIKKRLVNNELIVELDYESILSKVK
ncbi:phosphotransferase [Rossellomorea vietnamensis]|uniref:Phosphotransferase n=1 Tax=Rossellomorea vietnamensis TaxID=218284 RepID=A0A5D4NQ24_9BACI|nr:phosphotransferase [Rossellomorea vietnamensis]TYS15416.1 phosphotransferase [Rossellomorea vietnamensis]